MRVILEIAVTDFYLCLGRFPTNTAEYRLIVNSVRERNERGEDVVHILCEPEMAQRIRTFFLTYCPEVAERIRELPANDNS